MEDLEFSDAFCRFIQVALPTVEAAELLLLLRRDRDRWWHPTEAVAALRPGSNLAEAECVRLLELFQSRALIAVGPDKRVQYRPGDEELAGHVDKLVDAYRERPVTLIRMIYALRDTRIRSFADAFKLRKP
jgi:hypothetical protein